jgi:DNA replication and repair protein RecF
LFGRFADFKAGLAKSDKKLDIHVNGEAIKRRSELVRRVPVRIVNADSFALIDGAPQKRRAFIDWSLFHVEHDYAQVWADFNHALRQRNRLLKNRQDLHLLEYWDQHLLTPSIQLQQMRQHQCQELRRVMVEEFAELLDGIAIEMEYRQGWPAGTDLMDALKQQRHRDIKSGFTNVGIHRDDLWFTSAGHKADQVLSRGQGKRLCMALLMASLKLVGQKTGKQIILLVDDLHSELDREAQLKIYRQLTAMDLQLFVSNIDERLPEGLQTKEFKMFHVEHGTIKPRNFS